MEENRTILDPRFREDDIKKELDPSLRWDDTKAAKLAVFAGVLRRAGSGIRADLPRRGFTFEIFAFSFLLGILIRSLC